jgi:hypothetical protein
MESLDTVLVEVVPGELKLVSDCTDEELVAACLTLLLNNREREMPDEVWEWEFGRLRAIVVAKLWPTAEARAKDAAFLGRALKCLWPAIRDEAFAALMEGTT